MSEDVSRPACPGTPDSGWRKHENEGKRIPLADAAKV